jgi:hypothetical protein
VDSANPTSQTYHLVFWPRTSTRFCPKFYHGKEYKGVEFIPYIHIFKCDTEEEDRLGGKYMSRGINVSQICRYCCCPTTKSNDPHVDHEKKMVPMICQHPIDNVW